MGRDAFLSQTVDLFMIVRGELLWNPKTCVISLNVLALRGNLLCLYQHTKSACIKPLFVSIFVSTLINVVMRKKFSQIHKIN